MADLGFIGLGIMASPWPDSSSRLGMRSLFITTSDSASAGRD
jgi:hypothetical protein